MIIIDTGPVFKFFATNCQSQLTEALNGNVLNVPAAVEHEIFDTPTRHRQFKEVPLLCKKYKNKNVLSDVETEELQKCCLSVYGREFKEIDARSKDRGENMAILHGVVRARAGEEVVLICDDGPAIQKIKRLAQMLNYQRMRGLNKAGGSIKCVTTLDVLRWAIEAGSFHSKEHFRKKYEAMARLDEALPRDVKKTGLTGSPPW